MYWDVDIIPCEGGKVGLARIFWREREVERESSALIRTLREGSAQARWEAARALGYARSEATLAALLDALSDKDAVVRWQVVESLARRKDPVALAHLREALASKDRVRQAAAADALGLSSDSTAIEPLYRLLRHRHREVRQAAVQALGRLLDVTSAPTLVALAEDKSGDVIVRYAVIEALGKMRCRLATLDAGSRQRIQAALVAALTDLCPLLRSAAAKAAGRLGLRESVPALEEALRDADPYTRWQAARSLGCVGTWASLAHLKNALVDKETVFGKRIAWQAWRAFVMIPPREAIYRLRTLWQALSNRWRK